MMLHHYLRVILFVCCLIIPLGSCQEAHLNLPRNPQRVVSLKPNLTEILFALGVGDRVAGVTEHCIWPEEAKEKPKIGGYAAPDIEKILALKPDLVVTLKEDSSPRLVEILEKAGIPMLVLESGNLSQVYQTISQLAGAMNAMEQAQQVISDIKSSLKELADKTKSFAPKRTLVVIQRRPIIVAGQNTFPDELLRAAGAVNVVPKTRIHYPHLSMEQVLAWQPEVILDVDPSSNQSDWDAYQSLPASQQKQIYFLSQNLFVPGPRIAQAAQMIAHALYPDFK